MKDTSATAITRPESEPTLEGDISLERPAVNWRSILLGFLGVLFICGLTPYNNYALNNTDLVGSLLPTGLLFFFALFIFAVNAPLYRWQPRYAFTSGELGLALAMTLVSCTLPAGGLMRYLPGNLIGMISQARVNYDYSAMLRQAHLPSWIFPTFKSSDPAVQGGEDVVRFFLHANRADPDTFAARVANVPWSAWITPAITWGIFLAAVYGAVVFMSCIFRRQWVENERLPFPIASIYLSLIEAPEKGHAFNKLFRSKSFWVAFAIVFAMHGFNALNKYYPKVVPAFPLNFDLSSVMANPPLFNASGEFKRQTIYFTTIGITYFVQTRTAFSLWFFFLLFQVETMSYAAGQREFTEGMQQDQFFGSLLVYAAMMLWLARQHLAIVAGQMLRPVRSGEPVGRYISYRWAGWGLLVCISVLVGWLVCAGASASGAMVIVVMLGIVFMVVARVVAETGLVYVMLDVPLCRPFVYAANDFPAMLQARTSFISFFFGTFLTGVLKHALRQSFSPYASHALRTTDAEFDSRKESPAKSSGLPVIVCLASALLVGYLVSGTATLYVQYNVPFSLDKKHETPLNGWGTVLMPKYFLLDGLRKWVPPANGGVEPHSRLGHCAFGVALMTALTFMSVRYTAWPFHPIGFLLAYSLALRWMWFSIFLGWLAKVVVLRLGGGSLFRQSRSFFLGMIAGEAGAAAFWLCISVLLHMMGHEFISIQILLT